MYICMLHHLPQALQTSQFIPLLAWSTHLGSHFTCHINLGIIFVHTIFVLGNMALMACKSLITCIINNLPIIQAKSFPPRWTTTISGGTSRVPWDDSLKKPFQNIPLCPLHSSASQVSRPILWPQLIQEAYLAAQNIKLWLHNKTHIQANRNCKPKKRERKNRTPTVNISLVSLGGPPSYLLNLFFTIT